MQGEPSLMATGVCIAKFNALVFDHKLYNPTVQYVIVYVWHSEMPV